LLKVRQQGAQLILSAAQRAELLEELEAQLESGVDLRQRARPHLVREMAHAYVSELLGPPGISGVFGSRRGPGRPRHPRPDDPRVQEILDAFVRGLDPALQS
jgi:hypothetical protein